MHPTPIPAAVVWAAAERRVLSPPPGREDDVGFLEVIAEVVDGGVRYHARLELDPGELATLAAGGHVWLTFDGIVAPFGAAAMLDCGCRVVGGQLTPGCSSCITAPSPPPNATGTEGAGAP